MVHIFSIPLRVERRVFATSRSMTATRGFAIDVVYPIHPEADSSPVSIVAKPQT